MIISVIAEPRSGSTNLAIWFSHMLNFTVFFEPTNPTISGNSRFTNVLPDKWEYNTEHLFVKEIYTKDNAIQKKLIEISDKVIVLYREDKQSQFESWRHAVLTNRWDEPWLYKQTVPTIQAQNMYNSFLDLMDSMKTEYIDNDSYFKISYEELYYNNGIQRLLDHINLSNVENIEFPYGTKYRVDAKIDKFI